VSGPATVAAFAALLAVLALAQLPLQRGDAREWPRRRPTAAALALLARLGRRVGAPGAPRDLEARLAAAGRPLGLRPADVMAAKGGAAALGLALALPLGSLLPGRLGLLAPFALPLAAFIAPDLWLRRRSARRGAAMEEELPDLLDLLRVATEAGLPVGRALGEVGRRHGGPLAREWSASATELQLGVPRDEAFDRLVRRCPAPAVATLAAALRRAERHGAPLGETLAAQATEARAERARRIREHAAKAAPKIQLVVALLLVPSVLLLVAAALVGAFVR
jgi:tight adherence protein C